MNPRGRKTYAGVFPAEMSRPYQNVHIGGTTNFFNVKHRLNWVCFSSKRTADVLRKSTWRNLWIKVSFTFYCSIFDWNCNVVEFSKGPQDSPPTETSLKEHFVTAFMYIPAEIDSSSSSFSSFLSNTDSSTRSLSFSSGNLDFSTWKASFSRESLTILLLFLIWEMRCLLAECSASLCRCLLLCGLLVCQKVSTKHYISLIATLESQWLMQEH